MNTYRFDADSCREASGFCSTIYASLNSPSCPDAHTAWARGALASTTKARAAIFLTIDNILTRERDCRLLQLGKVGELVSNGASIILPFYNANMNAVAKRVFENSGITCY